MLYPAARMLRLPILTFIVFASLASPAVSQSSQPAAVVKHGEGYAVTHSLGLFPILLPKPGTPSVGEMIGIKDMHYGGKTIACMFTFGKAGNVDDTRIATEGILSTNVRALDIVRLVPDEYSIRLLINPQIANSEVVFVPNHIAQAIELLGGGERGELFSDYSVVLFMVRIRHNCEFFWEAVDFAPIGRKLDTNALLSDFGEKAKARIELGLKVANAMKSLKQMQLPVPSR